MDGQGGHMVGSCTPDWRSYLEQQRTKPSDWHSKLYCITEGTVCDALPREQRTFLQLNLGP